MKLYLFYSLMSVMTNPAARPLPNDDAVRDILRQVIDPEVGMNIVDLGLIYRIEPTSDRLLIEMTMTSPACPLGGMIVDQVKAALAPALPAGCVADVRLVSEPAWQVSMMSEAGKRHFGWKGEGHG